MGIHLVNVPTDILNMSAASVLVTVNICRSLFARCTITAGLPILSSSVTSFHTTPVINAEPMKKRKKVDPAVVLAREQRKRRRIEKQIRRLEKFSRKVKPVDEIVGDRKVLKQLELRKREVPELTAEERERRVLLEKEWCRYRSWVNKREAAAISRLVAAQQGALDELKAVSPELYDAAIQIDEHLLPYKSPMCVLTPPIKDYDPPDGDYIDTTKTYE